jgi:hypothetical protein
LAGLLVRGIGQSQDTRKVLKNSDINPCLFGYKKIEVIGNWIELHSQELHDLHSLPKIIRVFKYDESDGRGKWHVLGGKERCIQSFVGKHEGKRTFGRPKCRW